MPEITDKIIDFIKKNPSSSSKEIHGGSGTGISYATLKRVLQALIAENLVISRGRGKGTKYEIDPAYDVVRPVDMNQYFEQEIDEREIRRTFNQSLIRELHRYPLFTKTEFAHLDHLQDLYKINSQNLSPAEFKKELERLAIDLSWKSSQIEGNTYSLLETELLLKEQKTAKGKTKDEATMLLNHKAALDFIIAHPDYTEPLTIRAIEDIHSLLTEGLPIERNVRNHRVGISGTNYQPLDNEFQIREALKDMCEAINNHENVFVKSLLALVLLSYIQPFMDGNKRSARIISNAILINNNYCPVSFRTVDSIEYKKAMLIFYEQNNISPFKKIFMEQFEFAVNTYF
jgi:hypothetical protein